MKEKFKEIKMDGSINIKLSESRTWSADKRSLINSVRAICEQYKSNGDTLTLRQLYYQLVAKDLIPNHDKVYKKMSSIKDEIVYSGLVDWSTFEDRGRVPQYTYSDDSIQDALRKAKDYFRLDRQDGQDNHIEVWTEKDAISGILSKVTKPYSVPLVVNKGYTSSTAIYGAYSRFVDAIEDGQRIKILYFGDHDASGLDMIRDITDRLIMMFTQGQQLDVQEWWADSGYTLWDMQGMRGYEDVGELMDAEGLSPQKQEKLEKLFARGQVEMYLDDKEAFEVIPIGLTMEQIEEFKPPPNPAKNTDPRAKGYVAKFGNVSWEVDALKPNTMRKIVEHHIRDNMNIDIYDDLIIREESDKEKIVTIIDNLEEEE